MKEVLVISLEDSINIKENEAFATVDYNPIKRRQNCSKSLFKVTVQTHRVLFKALFKNYKNVTSKVYIKTHLPYLVSCFWKKKTFNYPFFLNLSLSQIVITLLAWQEGILFKTPLPCELLCNLNISIVQNLGYYLKR